MADNEQILGGCFVLTWALVVVVGVAAIGAIVYMASWLL